MADDVTESAWKPSVNAFEQKEAALNDGVIEEELVVRPPTLNPPVPGRTRHIQIGSKWRIWTPIGGETWQQH